MGAETVVLLVFPALILAGLAVIWMGMQSRRQIREMEHRERMAMIERGLTPSPEVDPAGFERGLVRSAPHESEKATRSRTAGIMMMGLGVAFIFLMSFAADQLAVGVGVGGAFAMIGGAFFVNAMMLRRSTPPPPPIRRAEPRVPPSATTPDL